MSRLRAWAPAGLSAAASVIATVASLAIVRGDGFGSYGTFVTLQAIGAILGIPMLWGVHVNASRMLALRDDTGAVIGTALRLTAVAIVLTSVGYLLLLTAVSPVVPVAAPSRLWPAAGLGASTAVMTLAESLLRIQGRQLLASGLRLGFAGGYLVAVVAVMLTGHGGAVLYAVLLTVANALCALLLLLGLRLSLLRRDPGLARTLRREGWSYSMSQSLLNLLFGFDAIMLIQAVGPSAVAVYALYISSLRRVIGVLFTDSLASLLIAYLSRRKLTISSRTALRLAPALLGGTVLGSAVLIVASLLAAGARDHLVLGWLALAAVGCTAHAVVIVLFAVFTVQPTLGFARVRTALLAAFAPGLALQGAAAAFGGVAGMIWVFAGINVAIACWFVAVLHHPMTAAGRPRSSRSDHVDPRVGQIDPPESALARKT